MPVPVSIEISMENLAIGFTVRAAVRLGDDFMRAGLDEFAFAAEFAGALDPFERGEVFAKLGDFGRAEALRGKGDDAEAQAEIAAHDFEDVGGFEIAGRFHGLAVDGDVSTGAGLGGEGAGFEDAHVVQPFVGTMAHAAVW